MGMRLLTDGSVHAKKPKSFVEIYLTVSGKYPSSRSDWILLN